MPRRRSAPSLEPEKIHRRNCTFCLFWPPPEVDYNHAHPSPRSWTLDPLLSLCLMCRITWLHHALRLAWFTHGCVTGGAPRVHLCEGQLGL